MICILALIVFGIMGIFSAAYRKIAKEAFDCVFRRITFRKCRTNLDSRLKSQITGKIMRKSPTTGKFIYKHFEVISWILLLITIASIVFTAIGAYNYIKYGNCNGAESDEYCIFAGDSKCSTFANKTDVIMPDLTGLSFEGPKDAPITMVEFGCLSCPYTKKAQPIVEKIKEKYQGQMKFYFILFPISAHNLSNLTNSAALCAREQGKFWEYADALFAQQETMTEETLYAIDVGLDKNSFATCMASEKTRQLLEAQYELGQNSKIYGTPTFFINGEALVGLKTFDKLDHTIQLHLKNP